MERIDPEIMCHSLNIDLERKLVRQSDVQCVEHYQALKDEIDKLLACDFTK